MKTAWRCFAVVACGLASAFACAQVRDFPSRPVRIVVPSAPGAILDLVARVIGPAMGEVMGQSVVVDNRPGAGTNIGMEVVARAPGDGYTLLVASNGLTVNPGMYAKLPFDVKKDFAPVSLVLSGAPYLLVVHPSLPVKSVKDLIALAHAKPGQLTHSSGGYGTNIYIMGALFKHLTGTNMLHVPYKSGGHALAGVVGGEAGMTFFAVAAVMPLVNAGKLRALAITSAKRSALLPKLPTLAEAGVAGYEFTSWVGILAPGTTPPAIVAALNGYIRKAVPASGMAERFASEGADVGASSPEQFAAHITAEIARWSKMIKDLDLRAE
jgi:tripartite-type tricarboxylate transporter receptor subunit TctC